MNEKNKEQVKILKEKIEKLLVEYRIKHDELEIATEEWDIAEIQVALDLLNKEILKLKKQISTLEAG